MVCGGGGEVFDCFDLGSLENESIGYNCIDVGVERCELLLRPSPSIASSDAISLVYTGPRIPRQWSDLIVVWHSSEKHLSIPFQTYL